MMLGAKFNRLTIIGNAPSVPDRHKRVLCQCDCGTVSTAEWRKVKSGHTKSCGCLYVEKAGKMNFQHGHAGTGKKTGAYRSWAAMMQRCAELPYRRDREWYRGVKICSRWQKFENFLADMGERPQGMTLDRYPNHAGNYEPSNCRWATMKEQAANRKQRRKSCDNS